ncbi:MAG: ribosome silencing factor [Catonella sp.]
MENILDAVRIVCKSLDEHLANDIKVIDIAHLTTISEYFIIADAKNENQMKALQDAVEESLGKAGINPERIEGGRSEHWILMDFGEFVVHIFSKEDREFYNIERIWSDGKMLDTDMLIR